MKIVVLDGYTLNPGDLSWEGLEQLGELLVYERTPKENTEIIKAIDNAEIIFTNKTPLTEEILVKVPTAKYIGVLATGYNVVDVVAAKKMGITVTNVPSYATDSVAQYDSHFYLKYAIMPGLIMNQCKKVNGRLVSIFATGIHL